HTALTYLFLLSLHDALPIFCILINKFVPEQAFEILMSLVVSCLIINWVMISFTHLKFRKFKDQAGIKTKFPSIIYPISNYICIVDRKSTRLNSSHVKISYAV